MENRDILMAIPLPEEFGYFGQIFRITSKTTVSGITCYDIDLGTTEISGAAFFLGRMGNTWAGIVTERMINRVNPRLVMLIGLAGSLDNDIKLGDLVIPREVNEYMDSSKAAPEGMKYSGAHSPTDFYLGRLVQEFAFSEPDLLKQWQQQAGAFKNHLNLPDKQMLLAREFPKIYTGHLATGNTVSAAKWYVDMLQGIDRKFEALDMESEGVIEAATQRDHPIRAMAVRGISDFSDERKKELEDQYKAGWRNYAVYNASLFVKNFINSSGFKEMMQTISRPPSQANSSAENKPEEKKEKVFNLTHDEAFELANLLVDTGLLGPASIQGFLLRINQDPTDYVYDNKPARLFALELITSLIKRNQFESLRYTGQEMKRILGGDKRRRVEQLLG